MFSPVFMSHKTIHFPGKQRFELRSGTGEPAVISYREREDTIVIEHTFVPPAMRGKGIAAHITRDALLEARRLGWKIVPDCSYVETFIQRNPEFIELLHHPGL
jgi:hypothetical protein